MKIKGKYICLFVALGVLGPLPACAQGKMSPVIKQAAKKMTQQQMRDVQFQQALFKKAVQQRLKEAVPADQFAPTSPDILSPAVYALNDKQIRLEKHRYYQAMKEFAALKKELDTRLFYIKTQKDVLPSADKANLYSRMFKVEEKLACLSLTFNDKPLNAARDYLLDARRTLNPYAALELEPPSHLRRSDRKFVQNEFFLHGPDGSAPQVKASRWPGPWRDLSRAKKLAAGIPPGLRIAFLNDLMPVEFTVASWHRKGIFPPGTQLRTYRRLQDFERDYARGERFDLIITDLIMSDGGGYALTAQLRRFDSSTPIIALSAVGEDPSRGKALFEMGFDGMLSTHATGGFPLEASGYLTLLNALNNYYQLKSTNGWLR